MALKATIAVLLGQSTAALVYVQSTLRLQLTLLRSTTVEDQGLHGSNFCFMPLEQLNNEMRWCVTSDAHTKSLERSAQASSAPSCRGISWSHEDRHYGDARACGSGGAWHVSCKVCPGSDKLLRWVYEFPDVHSTEFGMVAVPGSDLIQYARDPVAVVATSTSLGIPLRHENEVLAVIDRADSEFNDRSFFAYADTSGKVVIRRFDQPPLEWSIVGKLVIVHIPFDPRTTPSSGTWLEEGDVSM